MTATEQMFENLANQVASEPHSRKGLIRLANVLLGTKSLAWDGRGAEERKDHKSAYATSTPCGGQMHTK